MRENGIDAAIERRGDRAVERILAERPSLVVLDLMLPGEDGLSVCRRVRPRYSGPIVMLTARGEEEHQVLGLEGGADDYVAKPVRPRVLLARVHAHLRRASSDVASERIELGRLLMDGNTREVAIGGVRLDLTAAEFDLLWLLASHAERPLSRQLLSERLLGRPYDETDRCIDLRVSRLRQKIEAAGGDARCIRTVRAIGYVFDGVGR
jgi:two-component system, OmpR family, response regulator RstA